MSIREGLAAGALCVALALLAPSTTGAAPTRAQAVEPPPDDGATSITEVRTVLVGHPGDVEALARRLAALGIGAMPALLALLDESSGAQAPLERLAPAQRSAVLRAFRCLPHLEVLIFLRRVAAEAGETRRIQALHVLGEVATPRDLDLFTALADVGDQEPSDDGLSTALREELERLLRAHPGSAWALAGRLFEFPPVFYLTVLQALVGAGQDDLLRLLAGLLGRDARLDPLVLVELQRAAREACDSADPQVLAGVRPFLRSNDAELLVLGALAAGELDDAESIPCLVALLEHADHPVREAAVRSLRRVTGKDLGERAEAWEGWWRVESFWWRREGQGWLRRLREADPARVSEALLVLAEKPVFRREIAEAVRPCLQRKEIDLVCLACAVLGRLRACGAVPDLLDRLDGAHPRVHEAARAAVVRITGRHPVQPAAD